MLKSALNLYSVRDLNESTLQLIERVADANYDGIQFSGGWDGATLSEVEATLTEIDLEVAPPHVGIERLETKTDKLINRYRTLGQNNLVLSGLPAQFSSKPELNDAIATISDLSTRLAEDDFNLHYHNHTVEFEDLDGRPAYDYFVESTDIYLELDVGWVAMAGIDPVNLIYQLDDRIKILHMKDKDTETGEIVEGGQGDVDLQGCADAARDVGAEWLIYEHDYPDNPTYSLKYGAELMNRL